MGQKQSLHGPLTNFNDFFVLKKIAMFVTLKPHLHGRLLAARIDILPFFFLKLRTSLTRRKMHVRFCLRDIARHAPKKIKSQQSLTLEIF